ncbi:Spb1 C-terminal domain-containing protein [Lenzites betulinus]|nr:Spb1 C-terminal domain-containing protein [Lenzites betulinus]
MGKAQKKTGKGRLDKYYKLAKEQGYRARSAFKLIQLNKKYSILESAKCCIDLCAAPGGWLQVASKYMPTNSVIVGVDLVPIKPIPRVVTFAADITTTHCRNLLRNELKDWKADVVLHDGAPNVGTAWVQDAYSQSELVLMSMKLAAEFLIKGGTFVTKVFRSADYNNLIWVFHQLFGRVEATKPPSSRNVSAEIFVVCRDFLAPKHIDPKFFDPRHVFKELTASMPADEQSAAMSKKAQVNVFQPEKKRRQRSGYEDGDHTLYKEAGAADFIGCHDAVTFLGTYNKITFNTDEEKQWLSMDVTSPDVPVNCADLKVLGKGDFKLLIKWRTALREELGIDNKTKDAEELTETVEITEEVDEEAQIQEELERLNAEAAARAKRDRRRANEVKTRTIQRMQLRMTAPLDIGLEQNDDALRGGLDMFELDDAKALRGKRAGAGYDSDSDESASDAESDHEFLDEEEERERKVAGLEEELDGMYDAYQEHLKERDAKFKVQEARRNSKAREEWGGLSKGDEENDSDKEAGGYDRIQRAKARMGEESSDDDYSDVESSEEEEKPVAGKKRRADGPVPSSSKTKKARTVGKTDEPAISAPLSRSAELWFKQDMFAGADAEVDDDEEEDEEEMEMEEEESSEDEAMSGIEELASSEAEDDFDDFEIVPQDRSDDDADMWDVEGENEDEIKQAKIRKHGLTTAEAMSLATQLVNREKTRTELLNDGFNRYSLNAKDNLPSWFLDDEERHYKSNIPITKEAVDALRAKMRALDARPIKKVAEAKARKKFKAAQRLDKALKKAEGVNDMSDLTERDKAKQIEKVMAKGTQAKQRKEIKVVVAKGSHKGLKGRPKGVKGRYVMVDSRMKKEMRAKKRKDKANKKRKRS